jgi:hypothetical protein
VLHLLPKCLSFPSCCSFDWRMENYDWSQHAILRILCQL